MTIVSTDIAIAGMRAPVKFLTFQIYAFKVGTPSMLMRERESENFFSVTFSIPGQLLKMSLELVKDSNVKEIVSSDEYCFQISTSYHHVLFNLLLIFRY